MNSPAAQPFTATAHAGSLTTQEHTPAPFEAAVFGTYADPSVTILRVNDGYIATLADGEIVHSPKLRALRAYFRRWYPGSRVVYRPSTSPLASFWFAHRRKLISRTLRASIISLVCRWL